MKIIAIGSPTNAKLPESSIQDCLSKKYKISKKTELDSSLISTIYTYYIEQLSNSYLSIRLRSDMLFTEASSPIRYSTLPRQKSLCCINSTGGALSFTLASFGAKLIEVFYLKGKYTHTIPKYLSYGTTSSY